MDPSPDQNVRIPWWVTALDVLSAVVAGLLLRSVVSDDYQIRFTETLEISLRSSTRVAIWLAALLGLRHFLWRAVPWHARVGGTLRALVRSDALRAAWGPFIVSRTVVLSAGFVAVNTIGFVTKGRPAWDLGSSVLELFERWDAWWYFRIARQGYLYRSFFDPVQESEVAFFPALPLLMRAGRVVLDVNLWLAGIIIVTLAFVWGLTYVYRLARLDVPPAEARASVMFLAFYPFAVCYSAVLTESLFLLAAAGAFFHFRRGELWKAGLFGFFIGLLRPNGFQLAVPLGLMALLPFARHRGWIPRTEQGPVTNVRWPDLLVQLAIAALPILGMLLYAEHLDRLTGNPFAFVEAQQAWGRKPLGILDILNDRWALIRTEGWSGYVDLHMAEILDGAAALLGLAAIWPVTRRFGAAYGVFVAMTVLPPIISLGALSLGRFTAPLFPIFLWLGTSVPSERRPYLLAVFAAGQALIAVLFYTWRPPY
ncbi:MAG TPA: mannosyltransferase family protein [Vicinamibacterales bacterium]